MYRKYQFLAAAYFTSHHKIGGQGHSTHDLTIAQRRQLSHSTEWIPHKGSPGRGAEKTLTHSKQTLSGFGGRYSITPVMQSRYLTEPCGWAYCPHWGTATAFTASWWDKTNCSITYSPGTQWRMLGKMLFISYRLRADGDHAWKELIPWFLFLCSRKEGCSKEHHLQREGIHCTCTS